MEQVIEEVFVNEVKLDEQETEVLYERFNSVMKLLLNTMKEVDRTFNEVFERIFYTGSFFDGLKITEATEFDLNFVLKPQDLEMFPNRKYCSPGFIAIEVRSGLSSTFKDWIYMRGSTHLLNPASVRSWFQEVVHKALTKLQNEDELIEMGFQLKLKQNGPASTLSIISPEEPRRTIDVDLVPVLEFWTTKRGMNPSLKKKDIRMKGLHKSWFAVPKPGSSCSNCYRIPWRMSFPIQETEIMHDLQFFKYTLRMVKKVVEKLEIHEVASYYIKTLFFLELNKNCPDKWAREGHATLFIHMLKCLVEALENGEIPFFWNQNFNLIGTVSKATLKERAQTLKTFCGEIEAMAKENKNIKGEENYKKLKMRFESMLKLDDDFECVSGENKREVNLSEEIKAITVLKKYISQQHVATKDDISLLNKWEKIIKNSKNK